MELKSEQRIRYESEIALVQKRFGTLEDMRNALGFSQRKMAELLMVDPSAWTRWTKDESEKAPPHVYRALAWYMELLELRRETANAIVASGAPGSTVKSNVKISSVAGDIYGDWQKQIEILNEQSSKDLSELTEKLNKSERVTLGWKLFLLVNTVLVIYLLLIKSF